MLSSSLRAGLDNGSRFPQVFEPWRDLQRHPPPDRSVQGLPPDVQGNIHPKTAVTSILFHRNTPWQSAIRCSTNIFASLFIEARYKVAYMQGVVHAGHILAKRGRWESWQAGPRNEQGGFVFTPFSLVPYARAWPWCLPWAAHASYRSCLPSIRRQLVRGGFGSPDVIWTANPGSSVLKKLFPEAVLVFQVVDYYPAFSGDSIRRIERLDYHAADHIFVIGDTLKEYITSEHGIGEERITVLGQGVFLDRYQGDFALPDDLAGISPPIGIWVGVLDKGDPGLFRTAADTLQAAGGSLVLIGPEAPWATELARLCDNVHVVGPRSPDIVPDYLRHADVGLMLYERNRQQVYVGQNPLKLYEYAAAGLPVISTPHNEYSHLDPPVLTVTDETQVQEAITQVLSGREEFSRASLAFAESRSWQSIHRRATDIIGGLARG